MKNIHESLQSTKFLLVLTLISFLSVASALLAGGVILVGMTGNDSLDAWSVSEVSRACDEYNRNNPDDYMTWDTFGSAAEANSMAEEYGETMGLDSVVWGHGNGSDSMQVGGEDVKDSEFDNGYIKDTLHCKKNNGGDKSTQQMMDDTLKALKE